MPNFKYKAMNQQGDRIEGIYTAVNRDAVMEMININNYYPLVVEEERQTTNIEIDIFEKITTKDISIFCRQFYTMLNAGAPINTCLQVLTEQMTKKKFKKALEDVHDDVRKGLTLSEAMRKQSSIFPNLLVSMIAAGELTGNLDIIMQRMSTHYEKENKINNKVKTAMIYPTVLGVLTLTVVVVLLTFVVPIFVEMFTSSGVDLPTPTKILLGISDFFKNNIFIIIIIVFLVVIGLKYYFKTEKGMMLNHSMRLRIPILKSLNEKIVVSRFTRTMSTVLFSGVTLIDAMSIVDEVVGNKLVQKKLISAKEDLMKGEQFSKCIKRTEVFPPMLISMINIGEESGAIDDILNKTADFYDEELETQIQSSVATIEPIMIIIMGLIVGGIMAAIMMPMFSMYNNIS